MCVSWFGVYWITFHLVKNNGDEGRIKIQLDRALATSDWMENFLAAKLHHISMSAFDHSLLVLRFPSISNQSCVKGKFFQFEAMWLQDPWCDEVV